MYNITGLAHTDGYPSAYIASRLVFIAVIVLACVVIMRLSLEQAALRRLAIRLSVCSVYNVRAPKVQNRKVNLAPYACYICANRKWPCIFLC